MIRSALIASFACANLLSPVADEPARKMVEIGRWTMDCRADDTHCVLSTTFESSDAPNTVWAKLFVGRADGGFKVLVETPRLAAPGIELTIDDRHSGIIPNPVCSDEACDVVISFDADQARILSDARGGAVTMSLKQNEVVSLAFDLGGLGPAIERLPRIPDVGRSVDQSASDRRLDVHHSVDPGRASTR